MNRRSPSSLSVSSSSPEPLPVKERLEQKKKRIIADLHENEVRRMEARQKRTANTLQRFCRLNGIKHNAADSEDVARNRKLQYASNNVRDSDPENHDDTHDELHKIHETAKKKSVDDDDDAKPANMLRNNRKNDSDVVQERMTKYPPRELSGPEERERILREMREYISFNPQANSHWLKLVTRFDIGYVQATQMRSKILLRAATTSGKTRSRQMNPELRKSIKDWTAMYPNNEWLSRQRRDEIKKQMKSFIAQDPAVNSNWKVLALRFNIGYQQAIDIRNEVIQVSSSPIKPLNNSSNQKRALINPIGRAEELLRHYPKRRLSREERARCKNEMTDVLLDHPELNNQWATLADKFQLGYEQVMELRNEIQEELGMVEPKKESNSSKLSPKISENERIKNEIMKRRRISQTSSSSDDDRKQIVTTIEISDSSDDAAERRRNSALEFGLQNRRKKKAARRRIEICDDDSDDNDAENRQPTAVIRHDDGAEISPAARVIAAAGTPEPTNTKKAENARKLACTVSKIAKLYADEEKRLAYDEIATICDMPCEHVKSIIKRYLCHLIDKRLQQAVNGDLTDDRYVQNKYSLNKARVFQLQRILRWMPRASIMQIAQRARQEPGVIRAVMLHKLGMWRRDGDEEDENDDGEAMISHGNWRRASAAEKADNGLAHVEPEKIVTDQPSFRNIQRRSDAVQRDNDHTDDDDDDGIEEIVDMDVD